MPLEALLNRVPILDPERQLPVVVEPPPQDDWRDWPELTKIDVRPKTKGPGSRWLFTFADGTTRYTEDPQQAELFSRAFFHPGPKK